MRRPAGGTQRVSREKARWDEPWIAKAREKLSRKKIFSPFSLTGYLPLRSSGCLPRLSM
jgi:hypothetical protein